MAMHRQGQLDRTFHALGDGTRRKMLSLLVKRGECTATELGKPFPIAQPSASKHIRVLEEAGLVSRHVEGKNHRFRLVMKPLKDAQNWIARHQQFWEGSLDALGGLLDQMKEEGDR